jgi:hypothetical protein
LLRLQLQSIWYAGVSGPSAKGVQLGQPAVIYCRVSTADQSCERQERDLRVFAGRGGFEIVHGSQWKNGLLCASIQA